MVGETVDLVFAEGTDIQRVEANDLSLNIFEFITVDGDFTFEQSSVDGSSKILIGASNVGAFLGVDETGLSIVDGKLGLVLLDSEEAGAYALQAEGQAILNIENIVGVSTTVRIEVNHTGQALDETIDTGADTVHVAFADGTDVQGFDLTDFDVLLNDYLAALVDDLGAELVEKREGLLTDIDEDGNIIYNSRISEPIPGTSSSLDDMLGVSSFLGIGDYIQHYLHPALRPGESLPRNDEIPLGVYGDFGPTLSGLVEYLKVNWIPTTKGDVSGEGLTVNLTESGFDLAFNGAASFATDLAFVFGKEFNDFGLKIDGEVDLLANIATEVDFDLSFDWLNGGFNFNLNKLGFDINAAVDDVLLGAEFGPLSLSIGDPDGERAAAEFQFAGEISFVGGDFGFTPGTSFLDLDLPVFASIAGVNLSPGGTPRVKFGGQIFGGDGFSFTTENFENIFNFKDLSATDVILMIPDFLAYLDEVRNSGALTIEIPFLKKTVD